NDNERKELPDADDDQRHHDPVLAHEADGMVGEPGRLDQIVDQAELAVEQPFPDDHRYNSRNDVGKDHDRAQQPAAGKQLVEEKSSSEAEHDLQHNGGDGVDEAAPHRRPEFRIAQQEKIIVEADERLLGKEGVLVEEADPHPIEHGIDHQQSQEQNG